MTDKRKAALEALDRTCLSMCSTLNVTTGEERVEARITMEDAKLIRAALSSPQVGGNSVHGGAGGSFSTASPQWEDIERVRELLDEITQGKGRYSREPLEHADNCIEDMKALAHEALKLMPLPPAPKGIEG